MVFILQDNEAPYVMIRTVSRSAHWIGLYGAHELCIARHDHATLCFTRWSNSEQRGKKWAILKFDLYEGIILVLFSCAQQILTVLSELVLFYTTFLCLKLKSILMVDFHPRELMLKEEDKLFSTLVYSDPCRWAAMLTSSSLIEDVESRYRLAILEDSYTKRRRLQISVHEGHLRGCPVWTTFCEHHKKTLDNNQTLMLLQCHCILTARSPLGSSGSRIMSSGSGDSTHTFSVMGFQPQPHSPTGRCWCYALSTQKVRVLILSIWTNRLPI